MGVPFLELAFLVGVAVGHVASPRRAMRPEAPKRPVGTLLANALERVRTGTIRSPLVVSQTRASQPATAVAEDERTAAGSGSPTLRFRPFWLLHLGGWRPFRDGIEKT